MAVHKEYPTTSGQIIMNHYLSLWTLTTTQRNLFYLFSHVHFRCKTLKICYWVGTSRKHENQRSCNRTIFVGLRKVKNRWLYKLLTQVFNDEVLDCQRNFVQSDRLKNDHLFEAGQFLVPFARQRHIVRFV